MAQNSFRGSPEIGGSRLPDRDPKRSGRSGGRPGNLPGDDRNERDPVRQSEPLAPTDPLAMLDRKIQEFLGGGPALDPNDPSRRNPPRRPSDEEFDRPIGPTSTSEEEEPLLPGDPNDLGARGHRRRAKDDVTQSPVLRRGLLGV